MGTQGNARIRHARGGGEAGFSDSILILNVGELSAWMVWVCDWERERAEQAKCEGAHTRGSRGPLLQMYLISFFAGESELRRDEIEAPPTTAEAVVCGRNGLFSSEWAAAQCCGHEKDHRLAILGGTVPCAP